MLDTASPSSPYALLVLGGLAGLLGSLEMFRRRSSPSWRMPLIAAALLALIGAGSALANLPLHVWWPPTVLSLILLPLAMLQSPVPALIVRQLLTLLRQPRIQACLLFLTSIGLIVGQAYQLDQQLNREMESVEQQALAMVSPPLLEEVPDRSALTDTGRLVPLWRPKPGAHEGNLSAQEMTFLRTQGFELNLIRTSGVETAYNCHGWIFTGGRYWVRGGAVDDILRDNGYEVVSRPEPGDVAVYRNDKGEVMHTALVRALREDGTILLESKWGQLGCFLHTNTKHAYGDFSCTYYRTRRGGHLLRGRYTDELDRI